MKKFSTPSLRNVALIAPYMPHGRLATLEEAIDHDNSDFEQSPTLDPNLAKHATGLSEADKAARIAFLKNCTDSSFGSSGNDSFR